MHMSTDSFVTLSKVLELCLMSSCRNKDLEVSETKVQTYLRFLLHLTVVPIWLVTTHRHVTALIAGRQSQAKNSNSSLSRDILSETFCPIIFCNLKAFVYSINSPFHSLFLILLFNFITVWNLRYINNWHSPFLLNPCFHLR